MTIAARVSNAWKALRGESHGPYSLQSRELMILHGIDPDEIVSGSSGVSYRSVLGFDPVYRAVDLISGDVAKLPLRVVRRRENGGQETLSRHPVQELVSTVASPATYLTSQRWRVVIELRRLLLGNGYSWIRRNAADEAVALVPVSPDRVEVRYNVEGGLRYIVRSEKTESVVRVDPADMIHVRSLGNEYEGESVISLARQSFAVGLRAQEYAERFLAKGIRPSGILTHPGKLSPEGRKNLSESFGRAFGGSDNAGKVAVLEEGTTLSPWSLSLKDAEFLDLVGAQRTTVANWFGVPPHKLGAEERSASYKSLEERNRSYLQDGLDPRLVSWEAELSLKLLREEERRDGVSIQFDRNALVRADYATRVRSMTVAVGAPWMTANEARVEFGLVPVDGGEELIRPLNMGSAGAGAAGEGPDGGGADGADAADARSAARAAVAASLERMARRIHGQARRAARDPLSFLRTMGEKLEADVGVYEEAVGPALATLEALGGDPDGIVERFRSEAEERLLWATETTEAAFAARVEDELGAILEEAARIAAGVS